MRACQIINSLRDAMQAEGDSTSTSDRMDLFREWLRDDSERETLEVERVLQELEEKAQNPLVFFAPAVADDENSMDCY